MFSLYRKVFIPVADGSGQNLAEVVGMRIAGWNKIGSIWFTEENVTSRLPRKRTLWPHRPVQGGFSMVEAMTVLAVIALLGAVSMPSIRSGLSHLKLARAVDTFVNQIEFARSQASTRNRAYRVQVIMGQGSTRGRIIVTEGWGTVCNQLNFAENLGLKPTESVRDVNFTDEHPWVIINDVEPAGLIATSAGAYQGLCFKPDGRVLQISEGSDNGGFPLQPAPAGYGAGEAVFKLTLLGAGSAVTTQSAAREVVVPYNGIPRVEKIYADGGS